MAVYVKSEGEVNDIFSSSRPLSSAATYSTPQEIQRSSYFGVWVSGGPASATSAAGISMWYELAPTNTTTDFVCAGVCAVNASGLSAVASGMSISPYPMPFIRFGLSATRDLDATSKVNAKLFTQ